MSEVELEVVSKKIVLRFFVCAVIVYVLFFFSMSFNIHFYCRRRDKGLKSITDFGGVTVQDIGRIALRGGQHDRMCRYHCPRATGRDEMKLD
eukprot:gene26529-35200_t